MLIIGGQLGNMGWFIHICGMKKRVFCTVTNDLNYDQRMIRICTSLTNAGFSVTLVGREDRGSLPLDNRPYRQHRLKMWTRRGKLFYVEFHFRLFLYLLGRKMDVICAIDLDSILPCYFVSRLRRVPRVYDAHELFCEMQEVMSRPFIHRMWKKIERFAVPRFRFGYTVNEQIAGEFRRDYEVEYAVVRNLPVLEGAESAGDTTSGDDGMSGEKKVNGGEFAAIKVGKGGTMGAEPVPGRYILYQGAVNEGRCFETLIPAMRQVDARLVICGNGNFMAQARDLVRRHGLEEKVVFRGSVRPEELKAVTRSAWCGITLFERRGLSNYYSLANRFFDYMHAGIPQLAMNYPAYREINNCYPIAVLIDEPGVREVADALNALLTNPDLYQSLSEGCKQARLRYNWQEEEKILIRLYQEVLGTA
jgi:glycosyltransferase involved in cell wall biosynthesis